MLNLKKIRIYVYTGPWPRWLIPSLIFAYVGTVLLGVGLMLGWISPLPLMVVAMLASLVIIYTVMYMARQ